MMALLIVVNFVTVVVRWKNGTESEWRIFFSLFLSERKSGHDEIKIGANTRHVITLG